MDPSVCDEGMTKLLLRCDLWRNSHHRHSCIRLIALLVQEENRYPAGALKQLVDRLEQDALQVDSGAYASLLWACLNAKALPEGKRVHAHMSRSGFDKDAALSSQLAQMYLKCGSLANAQQVLEKMPVGDVVSWTRMIAAYAHHGHCKEALQYYQKMLLRGLMPNKITAVTVLNACVNEDSRQIQDNIVEIGLQSDAVVATVLITIHSKLGSMENAYSAFCWIREHDIVSWNAMISVYAQHDYAAEAIWLFRQMLLEGNMPDKVTFLAVLNAIASCGALAEGRQVHALVEDSGIEQDVALGNAIVNMYGKCGCLEEAIAVFDGMLGWDVISWTAMIAGYVQRGRMNEAMVAFRWMQLEGIAPNKVTFVTVLNSGEILIPLSEARQVHGYIVESGLETDIVMATALVSMFGNCQNPQEACQIFERVQQRDVILWTAMIAAYAQNGHPKEAAQLFQQMQLEGVVPSRATLIVMLDAYGTLSALKEGRQIHSRVVEKAFDTDAVVGNALINMYIKCGDLQSAWSYFHGMQCRDEATWNVTLAACVQHEHGRSRDVLPLFQQMQLAGVVPDKITLIAVINACASLASLSKAKQVHDRVAKSGFESDNVVANALVDMYGKCGSLDEARGVFRRIIGSQDVVSWNALITSHAQHGHVEEALQLFQEMQQEGVSPKDVTFVGVLSSCSHAGLVEEACCFFASMQRDHGLTATSEHHGCIIDLLGRVGWLQEAEEFINKMNVRADSVVWLTLLGACNLHGDVERGKRAAHRILELDAHNSAAHIMLSNIYAAASEDSSREGYVSCVQGKR